MPIPGGFFTAPTVTVTALSAPSPGVQVTVTLPAAGTTTVTVYRTDGTGQRVIVRGASKAVIAGAFTVADFEAPFGQTLTYTAVTYDPAGVASDESAGAAIIVGSATSWLTDPLAPDNAAPVRLRTPPDETLEIDRDIMTPVGSALGIQVSGTRSQGSYSLTLTAENATVRNTIRAVLRAAPVVLLRVPDPTWDLPAAFLGVGTIVMRRIGRIGEGARYIDLEATIVARPAPELAGPLYTYADMTGTGKSYTQLTATGRTYLQLVQQGAS
jgi:hypothetical protein